MVPKRWGWHEEEALSFSLLGCLLRKKPGQALVLFWDRTPTLCNSSGGFSLYLFYLFFLLLLLISKLLQLIFTFNLPLAMNSSTP
jgi:hypothetical protein